jgi:uncharacterized protein involved in exopolysaccharide biosynthesis
MELQKRLGILGFDPNHSQINASIEQLSRATNDARIARIIAESRYRMLSGMDPNSIEGSIDTIPGTTPSGLNALRTQLAGAKSSYAQMEANLGPNHPQAKAQKAQIDEMLREIDTEQNRLLLQAKQVFLAARTNEDQTAAALESQKADAYKLRDDLVEYTLRQREFESNRSLYENLLQRLRTADVQAGLDHHSHSAYLRHPCRHHPGLPDGKPRYRPSQRCGDREHHGASIARHRSALAARQWRSAEHVDCDAKHWLALTAQIAIR